MDHHMKAVDLECEQLASKAASPEQRATYYDVNSPANKHYHKDAKA